MARSQLKRGETGSQRTSCFTCDVPLRLSPSQLRTRNYCSNRCYHADKTKPKRKVVSGIRRSPWVERPCHTCGKMVERRVSDTRAHVFCSRQCFGKSDLARRGVGRPVSSPIGKRAVDQNGYVRVFVGAGHPMEINRGWALEHRLVMADFLGRPLLRTENVHHRNGDRTDNRLSNLELWVRSQPQGQRAIDLLEWAREIVDRYAPLETKLRKH